MTTEPTPEPEPVEIHPISGMVINRDHRDYRPDLNIHAKKELGLNKAGLATRDTPVEYDGDMWEKQLWETDKAWTAFTIYRDMDPIERSLVKAEAVYREARGLSPKKPNSKNSAGTFIKWSGRYRWAERVQAYDAFLDAKEIAAQKRRRIRAGSRQADNAVRMQEVLMHPVTKLEERIAAILNSETPDELDDLTQVELTKLVHTIAARMPDLHKDERDALGSNADVVAKPVQLKMRGEVLRKVLADRDLIGLAESLQFEVSQEVAEDEAQTG